MANKKPATAPVTPVDAPRGITDLDELGWIGHVIPAVLGIASLFAAVFSYRAEIQITLTVSLLVIGVMLPWLTWLSLHRSRPAWSFLIALAIVLGIMTLFGAPKVRTLAGIHMGVALIIPALFAVAAFTLSSLGHRYRA